MVAGSHRLGVSNITVAVKYHDGWERIHEAFRLSIARYTTQSLTSTEAFLGA